MAQNDAFGLCVLAVFASLASACASSGAPMAIPSDQVLATPASPHDEVAIAEEFHAAGIGADQLRGTLSAE